MFKQASFPAGLAGRYQLSRNLWFRKTGALFAARRLADRAMVAVLVDTGVDDGRWERMRARLDGIARAAGQSRFLATVLESGRDEDGTAFAAYAAPENFALVSEQVGERPFSALAGILLVRRVLAALAALHDADLAHGRPKPSHVLLAGDEVKLIAPLDPDDEHARVPERRAGGPATVAADVFVAGMLLSELCKGDPNHEGLRAILWRSLDDDPAARYPSAREMRAALDAHLVREQRTLLKRARELDEERRGPELWWDAEMPGESEPVDLVPGAGPIDATTGAGLIDPPTAAGLVEDIDPGIAAPMPPEPPVRSAPAAMLPAPIDAAPMRETGAPRRPDLEMFTARPARSPTVELRTAASAPPPDPRVAELAERLPAIDWLARLRAWVRGLAVGLSSLGGGRDAVDCTVCAPPSVSPGDIVMVQVFVHTPAQAGEARALAKTYDAAAEPRGSSSLETDVHRGARLDFQLVAPGFAVDRPRESLVWRGRPGSVNFFLPVPRDYSGKAIVATVLVSEAGKPLGHVRFKLDSARATDARPRAVGVEAMKYRRAYLAYAEPDRAEALRRAALLASLGIEVHQSIDGADLFLLFWSSRAKSSEDVARDVRDAVRRGIAIVPVLLEGPPVPAPPPELEGLPFGDFVGVLEPDGEVGEGTVLEGRFQIERLLGHGGMGAVYLARDRERGGAHVAIKLLLARFSGDAKALEMLREEAAIAMRLSHPNIVRLHNLEGKARAFLAMEFVEGGSLADQLAARLGGGTRPAGWSGKGLSPAEIAPLLEGIAAGLDHAHAERVIHRDIKPANVLLERRSTAVTPKVGDFGIARRMREGADAATQPSIAGTPPYMSPEHLLGERLDARADVYSLAATVYALLGGHPPFRTRAAILKENAPAIPGVPPGVMRAVARGLEKDPAARQASCGAFARDFRAGLAEPAPEDDVDTTVSYT